VLYDSNELPSSCLPITSYTCVTFASVWSAVTVLRLRLFGGRISYFESVKPNRWFEREARPLIPIGPTLMSRSFSILTLVELAKWLARHSALAVRLLGSLSIFSFQLKLR